MKTTITAERLRELLHYDPETGIFTWAVNISNVKAGSVAGTPSNDDGYIRTSIDGKRYLLHRLAWFYVNSEWPINQIDLKNGIRSDNRIGNLRNATNLENCQNIKARPGNPSGFLGVSRHENLWRAAISVNGKRTNLGRFKTPEEASAAYQAAKSKLHRFQPAQRSL